MTFKETLHTPVGCMEDLHDRSAVASQAEDAQVRLSWKQCVMPSTCIMTASQFLSWHAALPKNRACSSICFCSLFFQLFMHTITPVMHAIMHVKHAIVPVMCSDLLQNWMAARCQGDGAGAHHRPQGQEEYCQAQLFRSVQIAGVPTLQVWQLGCLHTTSV